MEEAEIKQTFGDVNNMMNHDHNVKNGVLYDIDIN